jgi:hypothetical protein
MFVTVITTVKAHWGDVMLQQVRLQALAQQLAINDEVKRARRLCKDNI